jgi:hypothetical protein
MRPWLPTTLAVALFVAGGCARYEYDLVSPPDLARHIGSKADEVLRVDPLEYRLRSFDNRLVVHVHNPTDDPVQLVGGQSYVVAPTGQSHPLRGQTIAPGTFIKLIFPPPRPYYPASHPNFGIGFGVGISRRVSAGYSSPLYDPLWNEPRYYTYYDENDATYWDWDGQTDAKVHLAFQRGGNTFAHDFTFHRKKM